MNSKSEFNTLLKNNFGHRLFIELMFVKTPCNPQELWFTSWDPNIPQIPSPTEPRPSLVQIMAYHLFSTEPLSEPMLYYCQLGPQEQTSVKLHWKFKHFHSKKCIWKCCLGNVGHFVSASMCERGGHIHKGTVCNTGQTLQCSMPSMEISNCLI